MTAPPKPPPDPQKKIFRTLKADFSRGDFIDSVRREVRDTREYLLDEDRRKKIAGKNPVSRGILTAWWMLKEMFFRLTPARRMLFVLGIFALLMGKTQLKAGSDLSLSFDLNFLAAGLLALVLMLELKDKLIAKEELEAGRFVQDALKPERNPELAGWDVWLFTRSANEVGGDLADFVRIDERRAAVVLGDVAGKGLRAALLMAKLQATVRAIGEDAPSLSAMAERVNRIFCRDSLRNIFASMVYLEIQAGSGGVRLVNAGHFPPLIVRGAGIESLPKGGVALGLTPGATYSEQEVELAPGEMLCAYSDGVTEAQNLAGDFFGEQRLKDILRDCAGRPADLAGTEIVNSVDRFVGEARRRDDLTLMVVGRPADS